MGYFVGDSIWGKGSNTAGLNQP